ncbi:UDP-N-acetylmuramoylalanine--D-glutamate ligase [hydrothermal vent metagenome]|uniref:UDP-N-acetylmuramoylalanine--D-glutamate ligase n=1 Tax=hydrothermal vent metagenome TaxID=652676 RepID=A0A3B1DDN0_9ZZZZ
MPCTRSNTDQTDFANMRVTVMGLGRFGGGLGVTRWLAARGAQVLVTDLEPETALAESIDHLRDLLDAGSVTLCLGEHREEDFIECELLIANPAVPRPWENPYLRAAREAGVEITTEIGLVVERLPSRERVIGVTGSAGKSTTAAMIAHVLRSCAQPVHLGGNIGGSLLDALDTITPNDWVVLELSSAMLHWLTGWSPGVAVVTNCTANHLDWHGTIEHYEGCKKGLLAHQQPGDAAVLGPTLGEWASATGVERIVLPEGAGVAGLSVPGAHNALNAAMACAVVEVVQEHGGRDAHPTFPTVAEVAEAVRTFGGLPHRLCLLGAHGGVRYYDDSKSTTPEATLLALRSFADRGELGRVHLIAGGHDKGSDLSPIAAQATALAGLYCIGSTGAELAHKAGEHGADCTTLGRAMDQIRSRAHQGDIVLLSPGCASWDQFENFEQRGRVFAALAGFGGGLCDEP